jgi:hypothetical protein
VNAPRTTYLVRPLLLLAFLLALPGGPWTPIAESAGQTAPARDIQEEILFQTASIRGLQPTEPVPFAFVQPEILRQDLMESFTDETSVRELEISRKLLVLLGLMSPDSDLHGMLVDLYAENVVGYYNRKEKTMYLVGGPSVFGPEEKVTLAHEYTHALQDQHFDLAAVQGGTEDDGDFSLAVEALIEGDATLTMILYARRFMTPEELSELQSGSAESSLDQAPLVIRDELIFPYEEGVLFVLRLWLEGGFELVNSTFRDPPRSTEQIIHPEKYLDREQPIVVSLPNLAGALGPDWTQLRSDVLGELDLRILLEQFSEPAVAATGAEGWGGDRFALLENAAGQNALVMSTVWDSEEEAGEFFNQYVATVGRRYGRRATRAEDVPSRIIWATPNGSLLVQKWGPRVVIIMAPDIPVMNSLLSAISPAAAPPPQPAPTAPAPMPAPVQVPR